MFRLSLITLLLWAGSATAAKTADDLTADQRTAVQIHVMAGEMAAGRNQAAEAAAQFLAALELVDDAALAERATLLAVSANERGLGLRAARRWLALAPNEADPREVIARYSLESDDADEALVQYQALVAGHAGGVDEGLQYVGRLLAQTNPNTARAAMQVADQLPALHPDRAAAQQALAIVALRFGLIEDAEKAARKAHAMQPQSKESTVLLAGVLVRRGKLEDADRLFESVIAQDSNPADLRMGYARILLDAGQREAARSQARKALAARPSDPDALHALGIMALNDRNYEEAGQHFQAALNGPRAQEAAYQLGVIAQQRKEYPEALRQFERVHSGTLAIEAVIRRATVLGHMDRLKEARASLAQLRRQLPQLASRLYGVEAGLLDELKQPDEALAVFARALDEKPDDADLFYGRSLLHEKMRRIDLAEADLRTMIRKDAQDARALNALGYMLTVHTARYAEARELIERAHKLEPDDPAIIDSLGWVSFKQGKPEAARTLLQKALDKAPDAEIAAHLGEVLWALGEKDRARSVWDEALRKDPEHDVLKQTIERLTATQ